MEGGSIVMPEPTKPIIPADNGGNDGGNNNNPSPAGNNAPPDAAAQAEAAAAEQAAADAQILEQVEKATGRKFDSIEAMKAAMPAEASVASELTDQQILEQVEKATGQKFESIEAMKAAIPAPQPTEAEIAAQKIAKEKLIVEAFTENGGNIESLVQIRKIAETAPEIIGETVIRNQLKLDGFTPDQIISELGDLTEAEIEALDPADKEIVAKKKAFYAKVFKTLGEKEVGEAKAAIEGLEQSVNDKLNLQTTGAKAEQNISSAIDEVASKLSGSKLELKLGQHLNEELPSIDLEISKEIVSEVAATLKDKGKRQELFFNNDGSLNYTRLAELLSKERMLESAVKTGFVKGMNQENQKWLAKFPKEAQQVFSGNQKAAAGAGGSIVEDSVRKGTRTN